jgi:hypothetical protein
LEVGVLVPVTEGLGGAVVDRVPRRAVDQIAEAERRAEREVAPIRVFEDDRAGRVLDE